jgi:hypothetical protein
MHQVGGPANVRRFTMTAPAQHEADVVVAMCSVRKLGFCHKFGLCSFAIPQKGIEFF